MGAAPVVLIVDDHEDSAAMYALALQWLGFSPLTAATAEEAFTCACCTRPDIVVADVTLPGASGLDLARQLRSDDRTRRTPILILTGHAEPSVRAEADAAGCDRFVLKPCAPDALALQIGEVLERGNARVPTGHSR